MATDATEVGGGKAIRVDAALVRGIGFWALAASVLNNTVGGGVFENPGSLAKDLGAFAPYILFLGALVFIPIALCFSAAGSRIHSTGGAYSYVAAAFGSFSGYLVASFLWISNVAASGAIAASLSDQMAYFFPAFAQPLPRTGFVIGAYLVLCALNARGVQIGARAIMALATIKLTPLVLLVVAGLFYIHPANLHVSALPPMAVIASSMGLVLFAYSGMETALLPSGEVRDPSSVVPRATLAAIVLVVLVYVGLQVVAQGVLGSALAGAKSPLADVAGLIVPAFRIVLLFAASVSLYGFMQNDIFGSSRLLYALARDGYLPSPLARITANHRVPLMAVALYAVIAAVLAIQGGFTGLALFSGKAICPVYIGVCMASWLLQRRGIRGDGKPFMLHGGPLVPLIGCASMVWILSTMEKNEWLAMGWAMFAVIVVYALVRWLGKSGTAATASNAPVERPAMQPQRPEVDADAGKADPARVAMRERHYRELAEHGFDCARWLPLYRTEDRQERLRPIDEIARRLLALLALFAWVDAPEEHVSNARVQGFIERNRLDAMLTPGERAMLAMPRAEARAAHGNMIGWRLENMWALAWILGFDPEPPFQQGQQPREIGKRLLFEFLPNMDASLDEFLAKTHPRETADVVRLEDLYYCAHNAVRSAQTGQATVPESFHPVRDGGTTHERRHALTWAMSPGVDWDATDLST